MNNTLKYQERKGIAAIAGIMAFRLLGLFMILPIFSLYIHKLPNATPWLIGLTLGIYGLIQGLLQIPFGALSDKLGRKPVIAIGLSLFILGSIVAALSHTIYGLMLGRAIQGAGAIGSTALALAADLTRDEKRTQAMAIIGLTIGLSFSLAIVLGPLINHWFHLSGIFWLTAGMGFVALLLLYVTIPNPPKPIQADHTTPLIKRLSNILKDRQLLRLDVGIFIQHAILTATFLAVPLLLTHQLGLNQAHQTIMYLVVLILAFLSMIPFVIIAEKYRKMKCIFNSCIAALIISQLLLIVFKPTISDTILALFIFFTAFTTLEATLPSLVSKISPIQSKGAAMGIYSSAQFLGIFAGGAIGGIMLQHFNLWGVFALNTALLILWQLLASTMKEPPYLSTLTYPINPEFDPKDLEKHLDIPGVCEAFCMKQEQLLYLKIDKKIITQDELQKRIEESNLVIVDGSS